MPRRADLTLSAPAKSDIYEIGEDVNDDPFDRDLEAQDDLLDADQANFLDDLESIGSIFSEEDEHEGRVDLS